MKKSTCVLLLGAVLSVAGCAKKTGSDSGGAGLSNSQSVHFDGFSGKAATAAGTVATALGSTFYTYSVSLWFKWEGSTFITNEGLFHLNPAGTSGHQYSAIVVGSNSSFLLDFFADPNNGTDQDAKSTAISTYNSAWHHVVGTWDTSTASINANAKLYVDGALQADLGTDVTGMMTAAGNFTVGQAFNSSGSTTYGWIDEVAIWKSTLSSTEVTALYNNGVPTDLKTDANGYASSSNLKVWWRMGDSDSTSGTTVTDVVSGINLTLSGGAAIQAVVPGT